MLNSPLSAGSHFGGFSAYNGVGGGFGANLRPSSPREGGGSATSEVSEHSIDTANVKASFGGGSPLALQAHSDDPAGLLITEDGVGSFAAASVSDIAKQHYEWAQELESVDQKQADLVVLQWKLVRNQTGMLAQQLVDVRKQIEDLQRGQESAMKRVDHLTADNDNFELRVKDFVRQLFEKLETSITKVKQDLETEAKRRDAGDVEVYKKLQQVTDDVGKSLKAMPLEQEVRKLRSDVSAHAAQIPALRDHVQEMADESKSAHDALLEFHRKVKESLDKEIRDRCMAHDDLHSSVHAAIERDRSEREANHSKLQGHVGSLQADLAGHREEMPLLRGRVQEFEEKLHNTHKEHLRNLETKFSDPALKLQQLDRRLEHMQASINQESTARQSLAEVFEQMLKTERTKLMNIITQKAQFARLDCEEMQKSLLEKLEQERAEREQGHEGLHAIHARHKAGLGERVTELEGECRIIGDKCQGLLAEVRDQEMQHRKLEDHLLGAFRDTTREFQAMVAEEKATREVLHAQLEEQLGWYGDQYDRVRELFIQKGPRSRLSIVGTRGPSTCASRAESPPSR